MLLLLLVSVCVCACVCLCVCAAPSGQDDTVTTVVLCPIGGARLRCGGGGAVREVVVVVVVLRCGVWLRGRVCVVHR